VVADCHVAETLETLERTVGDVLETLETFWRHWRRVGEQLENKWSSQCRLLLNLFRVAVRLERGALVGDDDRQ
jgi:hypothetical protein